MLAWLVNKTHTLYLPVRQPTCRQIMHTGTQNRIAWKAGLWCHRPRFLLGSVLFMVGVAGGCGEVGLPSLFAHLLRWVTWTVEGVGCGSSWMFLWWCLIENPLCNSYLVGGLEHEFYFSIYWEESSQLTFIFFRGVETTNQLFKSFKRFSVLQDTTPRFNDLSKQPCTFIPGFPGRVRVLLRRCIGGNCM